MYKETFKTSSTKNGFAPVLDRPTAYIIDRNGSKINRICDAFLRVFAMRPQTSLQNTITAHVCKSPPDLKGGLRIVSSLKGMIKFLSDESAAANTHPAEGEGTSEQAAEHICFLADVNQLYDDALGIYDLDVAILIAQQSQKVSPSCAIGSANHRRLTGSTRVSSLHPEPARNARTQKTVYYRQRSRTVQQSPVASS
jgi:elongator complex protein 1